LLTLLNFRKTTSFIAPSSQTCQWSLTRSRAVARKGAMQHVTTAYNSICCGRTNIIMHGAFRLRDC